MKMHNHGLKLVSHRPRSSQVAGRQTFNAQEIILAVYNDRMHDPERPELTRHSPQPQNTTNPFSTATEDKIGENACLSGNSRFEINLESSRRSTTIYRKQDAKDCNPSSLSKSPRDGEAETLKWVAG